MIIRYDREKLYELMWSFYTVSGIRFILFDADCNKLVSCPESDCEFCSLIREYSETSAKCKKSDRENFRKCREHDGAILYKCHAGLVEAALALRQNDAIIGYLMFGQVIDENEKDTALEKIKKYCVSFGIDAQKADEAIEKIPRKSSSEILASAKIMEACTSYILLKELVTPENDRIFELSKDYIEEHLGDDLSAQTLCMYLEISRTKLYEIFRNEIGTGVSEYIRKRRVHRAKKLLRTTDIPVWKIAENVGFSDYTYFDRVYKKIYGTSPLAYRKDKNKTK